MSKVIICVLLTILVFLGRGEVYAQTSLAKENPCQPSAEEILSVIKFVYKWSPSPKKVLITGEVRTIGYLHIPEEPLSLIQVVAMIGGVLKTARGPVYLIRQSSEDKTKSKLEIDLIGIKQGREKDVILEKGDVIFVPRGCVDGKLLPPPGTDFPIRVPNKRIA